uniref:Baculoviral IAP repeat containing 6 n=1 Tax=Rousettus aegyptiacus TaxID=9407 RepID=A0A7J8FE64_ROUAE|nr:baculoviral IAP repeat containing 6 [Rousettus aegyptiacus]
MLLAMSSSIQCMEQATSSVLFICQSQQHYRKFLTECQIHQASLLN